MKKDINSLSPEARAIIRAQVSRRSVLAGAQRLQLMSVIQKKLLDGQTGHFI
jgi:hypothetical protein